MKMHLRNISFFTILIHVILILENFKAVLSAKPCQVRLNCSTEAKTAWASDGDACHVFHNSCELRNENCLRHNFYFRTLSPTGKEECRAKCTEKCAKRTGPICAEYEGETRTFKDYCEYSFVVCMTGVRYIHPTFGECADAKKALD